MAAAALVAIGLTGCQDTAPTDGGSTSGSTSTTRSAAPKGEQGQQTGSLSTAKKLSVANAFLRAAGARDEAGMADYATPDVTDTFELEKGKKLTLSRCRTTNVEPGYDCQTELVEDTGGGTRSLNGVAHLRVTRIGDMVKVTDVHWMDH